MPRAVKFDRYGGIDVLRVVEVDRPVPVEPEVPQRLLQDLRAGALIHAFAYKIAVAIGIQTVAAPDAPAGRLGRQ
jgi:hypothetical protein